MSYSSATILSFGLPKLTKLSFTYLQYNYSKIAKINVGKLLFIIIYVIFIDLSFIFVSDIVDAVLTLDS